MWTPPWPFPHTADHLKTLTRLMGGGGYRGATGQLETLLGRPPKTLRRALENHPRIRKRQDDERADSLRQAGAEVFVATSPR